MRFPLTLALFFTLAIVGMVHTMDDKRNQHETIQSYFDKKHESIKEQTYVQNAALTDDKNDHDIFYIKTNKGSYIVEADEEKIRSVKKEKRN